MIELLSDNPLLKYLLLVSLFAIVSIAAYFTSLAVGARQMARQRLDEGRTTTDEGAVIGSLRSDRVESAWLKMVDGIEKAGLSLVDTKDANVRRKLIAAGYTATYAPRVYTLARLVLVIALPTLLLIYFWLTGSMPGTMGLYFSIVIAAAIGLYLPVLFVRARANGRQEEIINGFPDALDLLLVCVEAGLGLEAAFARVGMEMTESHPRIAEQFGNVVLEMRAGRNREDALRRMADRAAADEIRAFATLLIQSTKLGSSIAQTLRIYASEMRERRRLRAEEKAHRLPVLLSIPLVACMLPVMIGVLMLPAAIRVIRAILPALKAGEAEMRHGGMLFVTAAVLSCTACLGEQGKLEVRSTPTGLKAGQEPAPFRIAEARAHLVLGNVALALEGFRKAAREDPASVDALTGIAYCYDQMGRYDLSRRHYEMALALAPRDPALLAAFAGSLDRQGRTAEAASVRREMAALAVPSAPAVELASAAPKLPEIAAPLPAPAIPEAAAPVGPSVTIALPPPRPVGTKPVTPAQPQSQTMALAPVGRSVTIALPPARPAPVAAKPVAPVTVAGRSPRIERLSLMEVALVTGTGPRWVRPVTQPVRLAARTAPSKALEVRVLNAARVDRLASRTRAFLGRFGWRDIAVGDAAAVRSRSLIVYPQGTQQAASRLSARLGFAMAPRNDVRQLTILLGRDAAAHPGLRPKA